MNHSEFRQDIVSGDWILLSPGRLRRSQEFISRKKKREVTPISQCPFEKPLEKVSREVILEYTGKNGDWEILVLPNKYPAVQHCDSKIVSAVKGPYTVTPGVGHHELLITRDHHANFPKLKTDEAFHVFEAFRDRYLMLLADKNIRYISIFHNWGPLAGASVYHPHYQIIAIPVVPPDVEHSLKGAAAYYKKYKKCVHCVAIDWERKQRKRIIVETDRAIAFVPFVSRNPFEVRVFPKKHLPYFENTLDEELRGVVEVLQKVLSLIQKKLNDPDYNFFIHTVPLKDKERYRYYHWHIEIYPKFSVRAGFEFGTGMEINIVDPDLAAKILRK